jgi:hypothetical protein
MNAVLAKPIRAIWFIQASWLIWIKRLLRRFSLVCRRGCATIRRCPTRPEIAAMHNQRISKNISIRALSPR